MKNRSTDEPLLVLVFTLVPKDEVGKEGKVDTDEKKDESAGGQGGDDDVD